jgi:hypothetical protein
LANKSASAPNFLGQEISNSELLAAQYGVSSKTIRDIWNRKTWVHATASLVELVNNTSSDDRNFDFLNPQV